MEGPGEAVAARLGHAFADPSLLELALRHRSWCAEHGDPVSNERLEFLGDSVLGLVVSDRLHRHDPPLGEAAMSRRRSELVNTHALAALAQSVGLGEAVLLGKGEAATGGREKASILADALEAVFGAIYLDGGLAAAAAAIETVYGASLEQVEAAGIVADDKSRLQELAAQRELPPPRYLIEEEGPDHLKWFEATAEVGGEVVGRGGGRTKKEAEQAAARQALIALETTGGSESIGGHDGPSGPQMLGAPIGASGGEHARTA